MCISFCLEKEEGLNYRVLFNRILPNFGPSCDGHLSFSRGPLFLYGRRSFAFVVVVPEIETFLTTEKVACFCIFGQVHMRNRLLRLLFFPSREFSQLPKKAEDLSISWCWKAAAASSTFYYKISLPSFFLPSSDHAYSRHVFQSAFFLHTKAFLAVNTQQQEW